MKLTVRVSLGSYTTEADIHIDDGLTQINTLISKPKTFLTLTGTKEGYAVEVLDW